MRLQSSIIPIDPDVMKRAQRDFPIDDGGPNARITQRSYFLCALVQIHRVEISLFARMTPELCDAGGEF